MGSLYTGESSEKKKCFIFFLVHNTGSLNFSGTVWFLSAGLAESLIAKLYCCLLYRHECFTGKYTVHKIHTKLHPGPEWRIFHILTSEDIVGIISRFCTVVCAISRKTLVSNIIKRKLHGGLKIWILFSRVKSNILPTYEVLVHKILFLPLEK